MSYLVLARKYRPTTFDEVAGQEHITELLKKAVTTNRVAHAYLFCGPRGIGKTSCARILAKCLNCEDGPTLKPKADSQICKEIDQGTSFDVLEIDGASNRGIDEVRTVRENVKFAPSYGRYKIYIVDEVHMLTPEAFNALLKTLEEPPEHVKFIFATTDVQKVPATIISRCQRFDFKRIPLKTIIEMLSGICKKEKFKIDDEALLAIAKAAEGSLRDALSTLDQLSALSDKKSIAADDVISMLGTVETQLLFEMSDAISRKDCVEALKVLDQTIEQGKDIKQLTKDLVEHFRNLMVIKVGGKTLGKLVDYPIAIKEMLLTQSEQFSLKEILIAIDTLIETQDVARIMESMRMPLEIAFAKLTYQPGTPADTKAAAPAAKPKAQPATAKAALAKNAPVAKTTKESVLKNNKGHATFSIDDDDLEETEEEEKLGIEEVPETVDYVENLDIGKIRKAWSALTHAVSRTKMSVATYLQEGAPQEFKDATITIGFSKDHAFQLESLEDTENIKLVEKAFSEKLKTPIYIKYKIIDNYQPQAHEPMIEDALETFKGKVVNKWHND